MVIPGGVAGKSLLENKRMSEQLMLPAEARQRAGKGASRALRREGRVPAVVYGDKQEPLSVHVEEKLLAKMLSTGHFMNTIVMVEVGGEPNRTLPKDVQFHPVTSRPIHVDFLRIGEHAQVNVNVPVNFVNEEASPGLKRGGVLNVVRHELELVCDAARIPDQITIELDGLEIGDAIHISQVSLPEGSKSAIEDRDFTVATVVAPSAMKATEEEEEAPAADEVPAMEQEGDEAEGEGEAEGKAEGERDKE
jgi:large subunit ribosomal protein L25